MLGYYKLDLRQCAPLPESDSLRTTQYFVFSHFSINLHRETPDQGLRNRAHLNCNCLVLCKHFHVVFRLAAFSNLFLFWRLKRSSSCDSTRPQT
jgi:hypothetical protein